jgi:hypothetical protein
MFTCNLCKYSSVDKSNFNKHCKSNLHLTNEETKKYCSICDKKFINLQTYKQHKKNIHNKVKNIKTKDNTVKINVDNTNSDELSDTNIRDEIIKSKQEINIKLDEVNENIIKSKEEVKTVVNKAITKATSLIKYLMQHHQNVPPIKKISDKESIKLLRIDYECPLKKENDFVLEHRLIYDHANNRFIKNISKSILNIIDHKKPKTQPIYNTDSTRYNYVIKTTQEVWDEDKAGIKFSEYIIKPLLLSIEELIKNYRETKIETVNMRKNTLAENEEHIDLLSKILNLESDILNDRLITPILRELSPFLRYLQSEIEELEQYNEMEKIQKELEDIIKETNSNNSDDDIDYPIEIKPSLFKNKNKKIIFDNNILDEDINDNYVRKYNKRII